MTVPLTPIVIMLGTGDAESNVRTDAALPINLSHRERRPFQPSRLLQSRPTALKRRPCAQTTRLPITGANPAPTANATEPRPLSP